MLWLERNNIHEEHSKVKPRRHKSNEFVFGQKQKDEERLRVALASHRVAGWWEELPKRDEDLRELMNDGRIEELVREVVVFWQEWFLYENLPPCESQHDWAVSMREARLIKIRALARRCGIEELAHVNEVVLRAAIPCFATDEAGIMHAEQTHQQFQAEGCWWPYDIPAPSGVRVSIPPCWRGAFPKAAK